MAMAVDMVVDISILCRVYTILVLYVYVCL